jgi:predicted nucleotide-binding protein
MISMAVLRIPLPQAEEQLTERVELGRQLLQGTDIIYSIDLPVGAQHQALWQSAMSWHDYNCTWLLDNLGDEVRAEYQLVADRIYRTTARTRNSFETDILKEFLPLEISKLESIHNRLPLWVPTAEPIPQGSHTAHASHDSPIFIVHGSDTLRAESVARTVSTATGRKAIILREQPNLGRTLMEKFEQHAAEVSYAVIVLTADDKGGRADETDTRPRGRQNVILEMGYFYALIGRDRVSVLLQPGVEKPSDMDGIAYIPLDDRGAWKSELFRELRHAGFNIDL